MLDPADLAGLKEAYHPPQTGAPEKKRKASGKRELHTETGPKLEASRSSPQTMRRDDCLEKEGATRTYSTRASQMKSLSKNTEDPQTG